MGFGIWGLGFWVCVFAVEAVAQVEIGDLRASLTAEKKAQYVCMYKQ